MVLEQTTRNTHHLGGPPIKAHPWWVFSGAVPLGLVPVQIPLTCQGFEGCSRTPEEPDEHFGCLFLHAIRRDVFFFFLQGHLGRERRCFPGGASILTVSGGRGQRQKLDFFAGGTLIRWFLWGNQKDTNHHGVPEFEAATHVNSCFPYGSQSSSHFPVLCSLKKGMPKTVVRIVLAH